MRNLNCVQEPDLERLRKARHLRSGSMTETTRQEAVGRSREETAHGNTGLKSKHVAFIVCEVYVCWGGYVAMGLNTV
jgi:hypothetical protein